MAALDKLVGESERGKKTNGIVRATGTIHDDFPLEDVALIYETNFGSIRWVLGALIILLHDTSLVGSHSVV
jgi:hypothetical protein